ncbi:MAG: M15 family metallopeptidase [Treponema sp.]|jgi:D-alanyl-D-alanine carboxypeptidase|nr:M15 family metallopeptidase [Treponema sp.]
MLVFRRFFPVICLLLLLLSLVSCFRQKVSVKENSPVKINIVGNNTNSAKLDLVMRNAELPPALSARIKTTAAASPVFMADLSACLEGDRYLRALVDKRHSLPAGYAPSDLVTLTEGSYRVSRGGLTLRRSAAAALDEMAKAARADGVTLVASSTYRSYEYQTQVYNRNVREMGQEAADRESAKPGHSQHQTGLVVDFGSIDDSFAATAAGRWMTANASRFGWSLSFPDGYEAVTGYRWESWHYRYVGKSLAAFIDNYFDGIQQYALRFLYEWEQTGKP